jgi:hypothetical protein
MQTESSPNTGPTSDGTETSAPLTGPTLNQLTLFAEAFPVSRIPWLADNWAPPTIAISGPSTGDVFARLHRVDFDGCWLKTSAGFSQLTLDGSLEAFSETWPRAGCLLNGIAYLRPPSAPLTREIESGLWPTPTAGEHTRNKSDSAGAAVRYTLVGMARYNRWPTPTARDWKDGSYCPNVPINGLLGRAVWATPTAHPRTHMPRQVHHGAQLANQAGGALNPTWVEWLMGYPLGWTVLEDSATPSSRKSRNGSSAKSKQPKKG